MQFRADGLFSFAMAAAETFADIIHAKRGAMRLDVFAKTRLRIDPKTLYRLLRQLSCPHEGTRMLLAHRLGISRKRLDAALVA